MSRCSLALDRLLPMFSWNECAVSGVATVLLRYPCYQRCHVAIETLLLLPPLLYRTADRFLSSSANFEQNLLALRIWPSKQIASIALPQRPLIYGLSSGNLWPAMVLKVLLHLWNWFHSETQKYCFCFLPPPLAGGDVVSQYAKSPWGADAAPRKQ
jgi:hypothetical protein